jgi:hypothetical protein
LVADKAAIAIPYRHTAGLSTDYYRVCDDTVHAEPSPYTPQFLGVPVLPSTCTVRGTLIDVGGTPIATCIVQARVKELTVASGAMVSQISFVENVTDANGYWDLILIRNAKVWIRIPDLDISVEITVPDAATADFADLI